MGLDICQTTLAEASWALAEAAGHASGAIGVANAHVLALQHADRRFHGWMRAHDAILAETAPVVSALKSIHPDARRAERIYGPDLMDKTLSDYPEKCHFLLGRYAESLRILATKYGIPEERTLCTTEPEKEEARISTAIKKHKPEMIWVGFGTPYQQEWCATRRELHGLRIGVGFAFAANSGAQKRPPEWALRSGMAWLWRLAQEPGRLAPRYLKFNTAFLALWARELVRKRLNK